jgi:hypothetical protein
MTLISSVKNLITMYEKIASINRLEMFGLGGSSNSSDKQVELSNVTDYPSNIKQFELSNVTDYPSNIKHLNNQHQSFIDNNEQLSIDNNERSSTDNNEQLSIDNNKQSFIDNNDQSSIDNNKRLFINNNERSSTDNNKRSFIDNNIKSSYYNNNIFIDNNIQLSIGIKQSRNTNNHKPIYDNSYFSNDNSYFSNDNSYFSNDNIEKHIFQTFSSAILKAGPTIKHFLSLPKVKIKLIPFE